MNDTRRLIIFFIITFVVLLLTNFIYKPVKKQTVKPDTVVTRVVVQAETVKMVAEEGKEEEIVIDQEKFRAVFSNRGGGLKSFYLKEYSAELVPKESQLFTSVVGNRDLSKASFDYRLNQNELVFTKTIGKTTVEKKFFFDHEYGFKFKIKTEPENLIIVNSLDAGLASTEPKNKMDDINHFKFYVKRFDEVKNLTKEIRKQYTYEKNPEWIGLRTKYFFMALVNVDSLESLNARRLADKRIGLSLISSAKSNLSVYFLPVRYGLLRTFGRGFEEITKGGLLGPVSRFFLAILKVFYGLFRNYGWAIILFGFIVKAIFYPLSINMIKSQKKMQLIQPEIQKIQKKYKDNPTEMNREVMAMYKAYKVNPVGGCLPLVIQMPIFFALYSTLSTSIELAGRHFSCG